MVAVGWGLVGVAAWAQNESAPAPAAPSPRVLAVEMEGTKAVAKETCLARVQTKPGMPYTDSVVSEDIRRLFALGYFSDVQVKTESLTGGVKVVFVVTEKPSISAIQFQGNAHLRTEQLLKLLNLKVGDLHDARKVKDGLEQIKAEYRRKGYARVAVESSAVLDHAANTVTLYVAIDEGPRMRVRQIFIEGNTAFSDRRLRKLLKTKRRVWLSAGIYDEQVLQEDLERLRAFYRQHGYQDVAVDQQVATDPAGRALYVHLKIAEGIQHRVGQVTVNGAVLFPEHELRSLLALKPGAVYSTESLQADLRAIKQYYGDQGYINAQVAPQTKLDEATKRVDVTYAITEHELTYVNRVEVRGNLRTKDVVVRREMRIRPGQPFNGKAIRRSVERLYNLGIFEEVSVDTEPTQKPNREDLVVDVKEAKTGSFSFGGGFSSVDRLIGLIELEQRNFDLANWPTFIGAGQDLRLRGEFGTVRRYFDLSFTEPWMLGHPFSFGVDLFNQTRLRSRSLGLAYEEQRRGGGIRLGKELSETLRLDGHYQFFRTEISNVVDDASADLKAEQGRSNISLAGLTVTWDTRDNRFEPTHGLEWFTSAELAGGLLGGNRDFYRLQSGVSHYLPQTDRLMLESRLHTGIVNEFDGTQQVPIFERFFAGGLNTVRGFQERRVGPHDPKSNDPIGGEATLIGSLEEVWTFLKNDAGKSILKGSVFYDVGNVWRQVSDYGSSFEMGTGVGIRVSTPIGPVRLDLGFPVTRLANDKRKPRLHFNISRSF